LAGSGLSKQGHVGMAATAKLNTGSETKQKIGPPWCVAGSGLRHEGGACYKGGVSQGGDGGEWQRTAANGSQQRVAGER
jgi:hypothetical protein